MNTATLPSTDTRRLDIKGLRHYYPSVFKALYNKFKSQMQNNHKHTMFETAQELYAEYGITVKQPESESKTTVYWFLQPTVWYTSSKDIAWIVEEDRLKIAKRLRVKVAEVPECQIQCANEDEIWIRESTGTVYSINQLTSVNKVSEQLAKIGADLNGVMNKLQQLLVKVSHRNRPTVTKFIKYCTVFHHVYDPLGNILYVGARAWPNKLAPNMIIPGHSYAKADSKSNAETEQLYETKSETEANSEQENSQNRDIHQYLEQALGKLQQRILRLEDRVAVLSQTNNP